MSSDYLVSSLLDRAALFPKSIRVSLHFVTDYCVQISFKNIKDRNRNDIIAEKDRLMKN